MHASRLTLTVLSHLLPTAKIKRLSALSSGRTLVGLLGQPVLTIVRYRGGSWHDWVYSAIYHAIYHDISGHVCMTMPWLNLEIIS